MKPGLRREQKVRFRSVLLPPQNGGAPCPRLMETKYVEPANIEWTPNLIDDKYSRSAGELRAIRGRRLEMGLGIERWRWDWGNKESD